MTVPSKTLAPNGALVDLQTGRATPPFNNYLNNLTQNVNASAAGSVATGPGSGLFGGGNVAEGISIGIAANGVTNAMIRQSAAYSVLGRAFGTAGNVADITATADNRVLARISGVLAFWDLNLVPSTVADGNYGDITVSGVGTAWAINANVVSNAKFRQSTALTVVGRSAATTGNVADIAGTASQFLGVNAAATTLGFQTMAGDATLSGPTITLSSVITAGGPIGSATVAPIITYDAKGRLTTVTSATITPAASSITGGAALTKTDDVNVTLTLGGSPTTALLAAASLTLGWAGTLGVARGGTNLASYAVGDLLYASGATTLSKLADVATGNALISGGVTTAPAWGKIGLTTHVSGTLPIANGGTNQAALGDITRTSDTNVTLTLGGTPVGAVVTSTSFTLGWSGTLAFTRGGFGFGSAAQGDIFYADTTTSVAKLVKNTSATRYLSNTGTSNNPAWAQVDLSNGITGDLPYANFVQATQKCLVGATAAGDFGEITLGTGVAITAGVLSATGTGGTVTTISVVTANGVSGSVASATTTPAITLTLGAITPSSVATSGSGNITAGGNVIVWGGNGFSSGSIESNSGTGGLYIAAAGSAADENIRIVPKGAGFTQCTTGVEVATYVNAGTYVRTGSSTVAGLPLATVGIGARYIATDATVTTFASAPIGGGAFTVPVYSTGAAWLIG